MCDISGFQQVFCSSKVSIGATAKKFELNEYEIYAF